MNIDALSQNLTAYLTGYGRGCPERLQFITDCNDWPYMAHDAIRRRRAQFLEALDMETLEAIATHKVSLQQIAADLLKTL